MVRRATSLQKTEDAGRALVHLNAELAKRLNLSGDVIEVFCEEVSVILPYVIDESIPNQTIIIASGLENVALPGGPYSIVEIRAL